MNLEFVPTSLRVVIWGESNLLRYCFKHELFCFGDGSVCVTGDWTYRALDVMGKYSATKLQ